jgi:acyl-CoA dehydrogenase
MGVADGLSEVHKDVLTRQVLKDYSPVEGLWPSGHIISRRQRAAAEYADRLEAILGDRFDLVTSVL